jgi:PhoPQ-activated pathogenicity-related protein
VIPTVLQWANKILDGDPLPRFSWTFEPDGSIRVQTDTAPKAVRQWQAHNPNARDFRLESIGPAWTSSPLSSQGNGVYVGFVPQPSQGWSAFLVELDFGNGILLSTEVAITPDTLPFAGQACQ